MPNVPDEEMERCLLGAMLSSRSAWLDHGALVRPAMFAGQMNRLLWEELSAYYGEAREPDPVALTDFLEKRGTLAKCGGRDYFSDLHNAMPGALNPDFYASELAERAVKRWYWEGLTACRDLAKQVGVTVDEVESKLSDVLTRIAASRPRHAATFTDLLKVAFKEALSSPIFDDVGVPSGFRTLDDKLSGGFQPGQLILLAARPGVGKSSMAYNIACELACMGRKHVLFFSLEVSSYQVVKCMLACRAKVNTFHLKRRNASEEDKNRLLAVTDQFSLAPLTIDDNAGHTASSLASSARSVNQREKIALLIVDYLGLLGTGKALENRQNEVAFLSRSLKLLAKELACPVLALAQLNRESEKSATGKPSLHNLRDSGALEQDADVVLLLHGETLILAKNRHGPAGIDIPMTFDKQFLSWSEKHPFKEDGNGEPEQTRLPEKSASPPRGSDRDERYEPESGDDF